MNTKKLSEVERIKQESNFLRGTLSISLEDPITGAVADDDTQVSKFHGIYQQDDRDLRKERRQARLEPLYSFMLRARIPGGVVTPDQWRALDRLSRTWANGTIRLTTRQAVQFHGIYKENLRPLIRGLEDALLDSIAACGDVNRNVMCNPNPASDRLHREVQYWAERLSEKLLPASDAYREIWIDPERPPAPGSESGTGVRQAEPLYGPTYLPRKFKTVVAVPPVNDVDLFAHDLGFIAITDPGSTSGTGNDRLLGFNVTAGGGMGASHDDPETHPRLADVIGFCPPQALPEVAEAVVSVQRDYGNRSNRKRARLKYTIEDRGLGWFVREVQRRLRVPLEQARPFDFEHTGDRYGWTEEVGGRRHLTLFVENGRLRMRQMDGLLEITALAGGFRITANQNLIIANVAAGSKEQVDALVEEYGLDRHLRARPVRLNAMACVALPTCPLAMAEAERYLPELVDRVEERLAAHGLENEAITLRMTGCPNGCARPYLSEIGLVGKAPGSYNLHLGAAFNGTRLNRLFRENLGEAAILETLDDLFARFAGERETGEHFGDFLIRAGIVAPVAEGRESRLIQEVEYAA